MATSHAPLGEPRVPKPPRQGSAGTPHVRQAVKGGNMKGTGAGGKLATKSIKAPGSGTRGTSGNRTANSVPRS